jgi:hypothetical protein
MEESAITLTNHTLCYNFFFRNKHISRKLKLILKNTIIHRALTYGSETLTVTKRDRKKLEHFGKENV